MPSQHTLPAADTRRFDRVFAATVLLGAWLVFQVQPMAAKRILPWFGGGPAVWTTAMLFFQAALLAGYSYAHLSTRLLRPRAQAIVHATTLLAAAVSLAVYGAVVGDQWKPLGSGHPQLRILMILAVSVGLPYLMLAATAPLVQTWFGRRSAGRSPYRLYALSNFGSLAALVSYPVIVEPLLGIRAQGVIWSGLFVAFAMLCAASGWMASGRDRLSNSAADSAPLPAQARAAKAASKSARARKNAPVATHSTPSLLDRLFWLALPACASVMLLAVTNYLCQDVAPVPLLWIAPLVIYLLTFILTFESDRWYNRWAWLAALVFFSFAACDSWKQHATESFGWQVANHLALLLAVGMVCHGEVARLRPAPADLTSFYLHLAAGGAIGGLFVAVVAPRLFVDYYELPLGMLAAGLLAMGVLATDPGSALYKGGNLGAWIVIVLVGIVLAVMARNPYARDGSLIIAEERNFFGVLKVEEDELGSTGIKCHRLRHGRISHGAQFLGEKLRREPTQYYDPASGVGKLLDSLPADSPRRVGVVGLGTGTLAAYAKSGDEYTFYEIDPQVIALADRYFTYLADARERGAKLRIVADDARLALEREPPQQFDVLVLDAFSGDAIPVHLLTIEAFTTYLRQLHPSSGVLAVHITNRNLDLIPVVKAAADQLGLDATIVNSPANDVALVQAASWILLYPGKQGSGGDRVGQPLVLTADQPRPILWTDDYSSLLGVLRWD